MILRKKEDTDINEMILNVKMAADNAGLMHWIDTKIYGDAVREISTKAIGTTLLNNDYLAFPGDKEPFLHRSGRYSDTWGAGLFYLYRTDGSSLYQAGFRTVLVAKY